MTFRIDWDPGAIDIAARFLDDDPEGLRQVMDPIDLLTQEPRAEGSFPYGSEDLRRMYVDRYRVMFEIHPDDRTCTWGEPPDAAFERRQLVHVP